MAQSTNFGRKAITTFLHVVSGLKRNINGDDRLQVGPGPESKRDVDEASLEKPDANRLVSLSFWQRHWRWLLLLTMLCIVAIVVGGVVGASGEMVDSQFDIEAAPFAPQTLPSMSTTATPRYAFTVLLAHFGCLRRILC